jgi:hypothetical protein
MVVFRPEPHAQKHVRFEQAVDESGNTDGKKKNKTFQN